MRERPRVPVSTPDTRAPRASVPVPRIRVTISPVVTDMKIHGWARTLGMGGLYLEADTPLPDDTEVYIKMLMRVKRTPYHLKLIGWVAYRDGAGMGIQFDQKSVEKYPQFGDIVAHYLVSSPLMEGQGAPAR